MMEAPWIIWSIRFVITCLATAAISWGISFKVADYVVRANTSSASEAMRSLQQSIDLLNASVVASTDATNGLQAELSELLRRSEQHSASLSALDAKLTIVADAVQDAGIDIRVGGTPSGKIFKAEELREFFGGEEDSPIYLELDGKSSALPK